MHKLEEALIRIGLLNLGVPIDKGLQSLCSVFAITSEFKGLTTVIKSFDLILCVKRLLRAHGVDERHRARDFSGEVKHFYLKLSKIS